MKRKERRTMSAPEKSIIRRMRENGAKFAAIAGHLNLSPNTVKSFCRRNGIQPQMENKNYPIPNLCAQCGQPIAQPDHRKQKRFCSDKCRSRWWNAHRQELSHKSAVVTICACCGNRFESYPQEHRKYCCHVCYIQARFGGDRP